MKKNLENIEEKENELKKKMEELKDFIKRYYNDNITAEEKEIMERTKKMFEILWGKDA